MADSLLSNFILRLERGSLVLGNRFEPFASPCTPACNRCKLPPCWACFLL